MRLLKNELVCNIYFKCDNDLLSSAGNGSSSSLVAKKKRRGQSDLSDEQVCKLMCRFELQKHVTAAERKELARELHLTDTQVKIWFEHRRYNYRMQHLLAHPSDYGIKSPSPSFPIASIPVALSSPQALPTPGVQTSLYTLPGSAVHFRFPQLSLPTLRNSIYYPHSAGPLPSFTPLGPNSFCCPYPPVPFPHTLRYQQNTNLHV